MKYTREQLIKAQRKYNRDFLQNPQDYSEIETTEECATDQIDQLLSFIN